SSLVSSNSVWRSALRPASRSSPPCSRIFFDSDTSTPSPDESIYPVLLKSITNLREPSSSASRTFCFSSWRLPTMSWPSTPTITTPLLSFFRVNRIPLPLPRLENGDRRSVHNIIGGRAARQVRDRFGQSLQDRAERGPAAEALHEFVGDVAGVEVGEDQHVRPATDPGALGLPLGDFRHERRVGLQLAVEGEVRRRLASAQLRDRRLHALHARAFGTAAGAIRKKGDDRLVSHDAASIARRRDGDVGELHRGRLGDNGAVGKREHAVTVNHIKRARDRGDRRCHAHRPERGPDRIGARIHRAPDHHVGRTDPDQTRPARERMLQRLRGRSVRRESIGTPRAQVAGEKRHARIGNAPQHFHDAHPFLLDALGRLLHARIIAFGKDDAWSGVPRPLVDAVEKAHFPNLRFSAFWTPGSTSGDTSPPKRATSRTKLELTKVRSNAGTRNTVSIFGARFRFINAIWNSYSKSDTARSPRIITEAPTFLANSASNPSNDCTSTRLSGTAWRISATRSSSEKSGCFATLTATATMSVSTNSSDRWMRSS